MWSCPPTQSVSIFQVLWDVVVSLSPGFVLEPRLWGGIDKKSGKPWDIIHCIHYGSLPVGLSFHSVLYKVKWDGLRISTNKRF